MVKYLRIREFRNYFHIPVILSADPIRDQESGPLGTNKGLTGGRKKRRLNLRDMEVEL